MLRLADVQVDGCVLSTPLLQPADRCNQSNQSLLIGYFRLSSDVIIVISCDSTPR